MRFDTNCLIEPISREPYEDMWLDVSARTLTACSSTSMAVLDIAVDPGDVSGRVSVAAIEAAREQAEKKTAYLHCLEGVLRLPDGQELPRPEGGPPVDFDRALPAPGPTVTFRLNAHILLALAKALGVNKTGTVEITATLPPEGFEPGPLLVVNVDDGMGFGVMSPAVPL